jgi:zinc protease
MQFLRNILTCVLLAAAAITATAQELPKDKELKTGRLENGLTYYIRHNDSQKGLADFYIVHNVGALQEDDNQNGLAHFLEHMAFNGLKHYPKKTMLEFLGKNGVAFGSNVNAFTTRGETCYHIDNAPVGRESFVDSVLLILHDWSHDILCEQDELDAERGVIREEWRRGSDAKRRLFTKQTNMVYQGSKQTRRTVLGSLDVIDNFKRDEILDFYHKWYRPDLQAVIIVGDIDADAMEAKVRKMFSDIPAVENPTPKERYLAPEADGPKFQNNIDSTLSFLALKVFYRQDFPEVRNDEAFWKDQFCRTMIAGIMSLRMSQQIQKPDSPIKSAILVTYPESTDYYVSLFTILGKKDADQRDVLRFCESNVKSMLEYGITADETEAAKMQVEKRMHLDRPQRVTQNNEYVAVCHNNFISGYATTAPAELQKIQQRILDGITKEDLEPYIRKIFVDSDAIYSWFCNEDDKAKLPSTDEMKAIIADAKARPCFAEIKKADLSISLPEGTLGKEGKPIKGLDAKIWKLDNGITVYYMPAADANAAPDLSLMMYFSTGKEAFPQDRIKESKYAAALIRQYSGVRGLDAGELSKDMACKGITRIFRIDDDWARIMMSSQKDKAENAFKLAALLVSEPYVIDGEKLESAKRSTLESLGDEKSDAQRFNEISDSLLYSRHPWYGEADSAAVLAVDTSFVKEIYSREFQRVDGMQVFIASSLPQAQIEEYVRKYIASVPSMAYSYKIAHCKPFLPAYKGHKEFSMTGKKEITPSSQIFRQYDSQVKTDPKTLAAVDFVDYILSQRLLGQIREKRGGTYSIRFSTAVSKRHDGKSESSIDFKTRPELKDALVGDMDSVITRFCKEGPSEKEMDEAAKYLVKRQKERDLREAQNMTELNAKTVSAVRGYEDPSVDRIAAYQEVSAEDVRKAARILTKKNSYTMIYTEI